MPKPELQAEKAGVTALDLRITVAVLLCVLTSTILNALNLKFPFGEMRLEIIQKMTAAIACLLCCQDNTKISLKAGVNRMIITAIGGLVGVLVTPIDTGLNNQWLMVLMVALGVLLTLFLCKVAKVPYINARIGGVTFVLVSCTLGGHARIWYAVFRLVSTLYGALMVLLVTWAWERFLAKKAA